MIATRPTLPALLAYQPMYHMQPLTVTAELATGISLARLADIALDGILARTLLEAILGAEYYLLPDAKTDPIFVSLPLALQGPEASKMAAVPSGTWLDIQADLQDHWWWYACSATRGEVLAAETGYWNKRFDFSPGDAIYLGLSGRNQTMVIEKGRYKNAHQAMSIFHCQRLSWSVMGDGEQIEMLLSLVDVLAHKRNYGYGRVQRWRVEAATQDESLWSADGRLMRPVPSTLLGEIAPTLPADAPISLAWRAYRAPQWAVYNQTVCAIWN